MNSLTQFIVDNPFSFVFGSVLIFAFFLFVFYQKRIVESNYFAMNIDVVKPVIVTPFEPNKDADELMHRINGYRERSDLDKLREDGTLKEMAYEHLGVMIGQNENIPYLSESSKHAITHVTGVTSTTKKTICSTFIGHEHNLPDLTKILAQDINSIGCASKLHNGTYYTVALFARFNPALDLP